MKDAAKFLVSVSAMIASVLAMTANPLLIPPALVVFYEGTRNANQAFYRNKIKDSFFIGAKRTTVVDGEKRKCTHLTQEATPSIKRLLNLRKNVKLNNGNTFEVYTLEALNAFQQLEPGLYTTRSQSMTKLLLQTMKKEGYITNLQSKQAKSSKLRLEKFLFGVKDNPNKMKKKSDEGYKMYDFTFEVTDKKMTKDYITKLLSSRNIDINGLDHKIDKKGNIIFSGLYTKEYENIKKEKLEELKQNNENISLLSEVKNDKVEEQKTEEKDVDELGVRAKNQTIDDPELERKKDEIRKYLDSQNANELTNETSIKKM